MSDLTSIYEEQEKIDPLSETTLHLRLMVSETGEKLANATGFLYRFKEDIYLVTNWHNMTGRNPITRQRLTNHAGVPDQILTYLILEKIEDGKVRTLHSMKLYFDEEKCKPRWLIHSVHREKVDVVAIKMEDIPKGVYLLPINDCKFREDYADQVMDTVFILGYPIELQNHGDFPIWKKASIATEPIFDIDGLPKLLVDTATRPGMSGAPVISIKNSSFKDGKFTGLIGYIRKFVGIYSGRLGEDEKMAQLGIVWRKEVIEEIITGNEYDNDDFYTK